MVTEKGSVKVSTPVTERVQRELNKPSYRLGVIFIVLAAVFFLIIVLTLCFDSYDNFWVPGFLAAFFLVFGIFTLVGCKANVREATKFNYVHEVEFFRNYFIFREYTDGEHTASIKIYYTRLIKVKETANYLYLYNTRMTAVAVDKHNLPANELNAVLKLLGRPALGNSVYIPEQPIQKNNTGAEQYAQNGFGGAQGRTEQPARDNPPSEPFAEFSSDGDDNAQGKELSDD